MSNPHTVTKQFEAELCAYTGAPYAVAVNSCTMAILMAVAWHLRDTMKVESLWLDGTRGELKAHLCPSIEIPKRTYISVPMSIIHAGGRPTFRDEEWKGAYRLKPLPIYDSARWFTEKMYHELTWLDACTRDPGGCLEHLMVCVSFHASKTLGLEQGGAILHDSQDADAWLRRARFDGRTEGLAPKDDTFNQIGWHCYMNPSTAAHGILRLHSLPRHNDPLPNDDYPDLSQMEIFK